jgi:hypothetical protein
MRYVTLSDCQVDFKLNNGSVKVTVKNADAYFSYATLQNSSTNRDM